MCHMENLDWQSTRVIITNSRHLWDALGPSLLLALSPGVISPYLPVVTPVICLGNPECCFRDIRVVYNKGDTNGRKMTVELPRVSTWLIWRFFVTSAQEETYKRFHRRYLLSSPQRLAFRCPLPSAVCPRRALCRIDNEPAIWLWRRHAIIHAALSVIGNVLCRCHFALSEARKENDSV